MFLKYLRLKNIRTYDDFEVEFPEGSILFEGGIGCGKSTLLLAIEFALFGLGEEKGTSLLSLGKNEGEVELAFESERGECRVFRSLLRTKRGAGVNQGIMIPGGVRQDRCWIDHGGRKVTLSPKEMKERVLQILGYNEPTNPRSKSDIFRYAVYTPQEEMKSIVAPQATEQRLETIRKALRLEEYKTAGANAREIMKEIEANVKLLNARAKDLPEIVAKLEGLRGEAAGLEAAVTECESELRDAEDELELRRKIGEELRERVERLSGAARLRGELMGRLGRVEEGIRALSTSISASNGKVAELKRRIGSASVADPGMGRREVEAEIREARKELAECASRLGMVEKEVELYSRLIKQGRCPTCRRDVSAEEFEPALEEASIRYRKLREAKEDRERIIEHFEELREKIARYEREAGQLSELKERLRETEERLRRDEGELEKLASERDDLQVRLRATEEASEYEAAQIEYGRNEGELREWSRRVTDLSGKLGSMRSRLSQIRERIAEREEEKRVIEASVDKASVLKAYAAWLGEYFIPAVDRIEATVMAAANVEFDSEFRKWFAYMVEDPTKSVRVEEDFTPLVAQDSYEQEVANLSGGERTALALAYRLALNRVVQRNAGLTSSLLLLDEPTDGFSKEQIGRLGDLLKELDLRQAIIVSHERELEGAVDHIFRVEKENGRSTVRQVG